MSNIVLPFDEHELHNRLELTATSTARADGVATNSATARLSRHGQPLSGQYLCFYLSGDALFIQGGQQVTVATDERGEAKVFFTDTRQETVLVTCHFQQSRASECALFSNVATPGLGLMAWVIRNSAPANNFTENYINYYLINVNGGPVTSAWVDFGVSGSAVMRFREGLVTAYGFRNFYQNSVAEQVQVSAYVRGFNGVDNHTLVIFTR